MISKFIVSKVAAHDPVISNQHITQCAEIILNRIAKPLNETFTGLMYILQEFRIYFA